MLEYGASDLDRYLTWAKLNLNELMRKRAYICKRILHHWPEMWFLHYVVPPLTGRGLPYLEGKEGVQAAPKWFFHHQVVLPLSRGGRTCTELTCTRFDYHKRYQSTDWP